ncbi:MAG: SDR family oxidoreductase [Vulcanimicrobiaceae bacterium]|jgi:NAD(P)-dependent dehydrogenase (short-subunit alcohol dehydrogenase family)
MSTKKSVLITGASTGFGRLTAEAFAADGWRVFGTMRHASGANAAAADALRASGVDVLELEVTSDASVDAAAATIAKEVGALDVLVNNAGVAWFGIQEAFTPRRVEQLYATNVFGPLRVNRAFLPAMRERKSGLIVFISSVVGRLVFPFGGVYDSSKWALEALAQAASYELAPFDVDVAIVEPGAFPTEIIGKHVGPDDEARQRSYGAELAAMSEGAIDRIVQNAQGNDPKDVASVVLRLANAPAGTRPFRSVVPANPAVEAINAATEPIQRQRIESLGVPALLPKVPA